MCTHRSERYDKECGVTFLRLFLVHTHGLINLFNNYLLHVFTNIIHENVLIQMKKREKKLECQILHKREREFFARAR